MQEEPLDWDDAIDPDDLVDEDEQPSGAPDRRTRWWALGGLAIATAFVVSVVLSTGSSSVPVGGSGSMAGMTMSMGDGPMAFTMPDVDDRTVRLPGARAGVVVFRRGARLRAMRRVGTRRPRCGAQHPQERATDRRHG